MPVRSFPQATPILIALLLGSTVPATAGPLEKAVQQGHQLFMHDTFDGNGRTCNSCHSHGGTSRGQLPNGKAIPSLTNAAAIFPRYNPRRDALLTLQDQVHNCVLGALEGTPPAHDSLQMRQLISYLTSLAQGKRIEMGGKPE
jgi:thiosulfate dehydrogenase